MRMMLRTIAIGAAATSLGYLAFVALSGSPASEARDPLPHAVQLRDGDVIIQREVNVIVSRLRSPQERASENNRRLAPCATVRAGGGNASIFPEFTADCPEGSTIGISIDFLDGGPPFAAVVSPAIEWRAARTGESSRSVVARIPPPSTSGGPEAAPDSTTPALPSSVENREGQVASLWPYVGIAASVALFAATFAVRRASRSAR